MTLTLDQYLDALRAEGTRFATAIATTLDTVGPQASIATCEWTMRDLVLHIGEVHRWAASIVNLAAVKPSAVDPNFLGPLPSDDDLLSWFLEGHAGIVGALSTARHDLECFTFLNDPPSPLIFWARRQVHETEIHRIDAESALGLDTPIDVLLAADGVDEMLTGFVPRKHTPLHSDTMVTMQVACDDDAGAWRMTISADAPRTERTVGDRQTLPDCTVTGSSNDLYQALWNRIDTATLRIGGDPAILDLVRDNVRIRWS